MLTRLDTYYFDILGIKATILWQYLIFKIDEIEIEEDAIEHYKATNGISKPNMDFYEPEKRRSNKNGYWQINQEEIQKETTLNKTEQRNATKILKEKRLIKVKRKGIPSSNHYKIIRKG